jgi:hypothetical protein
MEKNASLWISSITGNTAMIAEGVRQTLEDLGWAVSDAALGLEPEENVVLICFWCRKSSLDPKSLEFLETCRGKRILLFGTFGGFPAGKYAQLVRSNVTRLVQERNECLGVFLSQGRIRAQRIEERKALPADHPHHLDDWGVVRLTEGLNHPNATDVLYAQAFARDYLPADDEDAARSAST